MGVLTVVGDVHGRIKDFNILAKKKGHLVQIGDMGFNYSDLQLGENQYFFPGNHDNFGASHPRCLGNFKKLHGTLFLENKNIFWVGGAFSIDKNFRIMGRDYFPQEDMPWEEADEALSLYKDLKPEIVLSHDVGTDIARHFFTYPRWFRAMQNCLMDEMFKHHQPKIWVFGHHHKSVRCSLHDTLFVCLNELEAFDINLEMV